MGLSFNGHELVETRFQLLRITLQREVGKDNVHRTLMIVENMYGQDDENSAVYFQ